MKKVLALIVLASMVFGLSAFSCSSTELTSAKLYIQQKNLDRALEVLQQEVQKNPKSDEGFYLLGYVYGEKGDFDKMLESYDKSLKISNKFEKEIDNSKTFYWANNFNRGVAQFNRAGKVSTADSASMFFDKAITSFTTAIKCQPDSIATYDNLVYAYLSRGDYDLAIPVLEDLLKIKKSADAYSRLGEIYYTKAVGKMNDFATNGNKEDSLAAMADYDKAIKVLEEGKKEYPDDDNINVYLFNSYIGANKIDVAMTAAKELVKKDPENKQNHYNLGSLYLNANDYENAEKEFLEALKIDPEYISAVYNIALTYIKWGQKLRMATEEAESADDSYKGKFESALPYIEQYLQTEEGSKEPAIWEILGKIYANLGNTEKSTEAFNKADELRK
ncbi:MAG: tetratricopeptide repeat protein [Chlorobi bacterium]|nr:tetratricopeptide repeat protein [Chlorobiota bacterium]